MWLNVCNVLDGTVCLLETNDHKPLVTNEGQWYVCNVLYDIVYLLETNHHQPLVTNEGQWGYKRGAVEPLARICNPCHLTTRYE